MEDVLYVGNDSIYEDDQGSFVYVKNGEQREQRYIETGVSDTVNTEVISGLSEGEKCIIHQRLHGRMHMRNIR